MKQFWNEVQPVDSFFVTMNGILHDYDRKVISLLYQPLIGTPSTSMYITMYYTAEENRFYSEEWNHYYLMNVLDLNMQDIYQARMKLEGIGLLKTFLKRNSEKTIFHYELQPPLSAEQFFTDGMLNIYLYQKLGQPQFLKLKSMFSTLQADESEFHDITRSFQDVFSSMGVHALDNEGHEASAAEADQRFIHREDPRPIKISGQDFDFDLLMAGLSSSMVPRKVFTKEVKEAIAKLSFLYSINAIDMQGIVLSSLTPEQTIDIEEMRKAARDWYQMENDDRLPQLIDRFQPIMYRESHEPGTSRKSKLIHYLETTSPRQLLIDLSEGAQPAKSDLTAVEEIMFQQKLEPGVMNVLIHYVMLKTDMKLSKNYLEKIASHWVRKRIKTVREAMDLAINEHRQYQTWASGKKERQQRRKKPIRTEKLPEWFITQDETGHEQQTPAEDQHELEERRRRLEAIQKKYQKSGGEKGGNHQ